MHTFIVEICDIKSAKKQIFSICEIFDGIKPSNRVRAHTIVNEMFLNLIMHTPRGGIINIDISNNVVTIESVDDGDGIKDLKKAFTKGYSTASENWKLCRCGSGYGMGAMRDNSDEFQIDTGHEGTKIKIIIYDK